MAKVVRVEVRRDGDVKETFTEGTEEEMHNAAWVYVLKHQSNSVDWAMRYEGWDVVTVLDTGNTKSAARGE